MRFPSLRISTRLLLLNLLIFAAFFLVVGVILVSFREAREMLGTVTGREVNRVVTNSHAARHFATLFSDIEVLSNTFFGREKYLEEQEKQLFQLIRVIEAEVGDVRMSNAIAEYARELSGFLNDCKAINNLLDFREQTDRKTLAELNRLERSINELKREAKISKEDSPAADQLLALCAGYRESVLRIGKLFSETVFSSRITASRTRMAPVMSELDALAIKLEKATASTPDLAVFGKGIIAAVQDYRAAVQRVDESILQHHVQRTRLKRSKMKVMEILRQVDEDAAQTSASVSASINRVFFSAGSMMLLLSLVVVALLAIGTSYLFHRMINRPMNQLRAGLKSFGAGVPETRLQLGRSDDWQIIETAFNTMADDLSSSYQALSLSEKKYRELAELLPQPVFELDYQGAFTFSNRRVTDIFGYDAQELINGIHIYQLVDPSQTDDVHKVIRDVMAGTDIEGAEMLALRKDGLLVPVLIYCAPIRNQQGVIGIRGIAVDITEHKQAEKELAQHRDLLEVLVEKRTVALRQALAELRDSESLYRNLSTQMHDGFVILDASFHLVYVNPRMQELLGYERDELLNRHAADFLTKENVRLVDGKLAETRKSGESIRFEASLMSKEGKEVNVMISSRPEIVNGQLKRYYSICTDITQLKASERALKENQENLEEKIRMRTHELEIARDNAEKANQLKNEFLANVSHELRTPMHAILSYSKFGAKKIDIKPKERIREYFTNIYLSGKRLLVFLNDLLDLSSLQAEKTDYDLQYQDLRQTFREMKSEVLPLLQEKDLYITIEKEPAIMITYDNLKIKQVVSNLFNNAIKFAEPGSDITIEFVDEQERVNVMIKNCGVPIPSKELTTIFDPFIQSSVTKTGAGGTGLGLPICKKIIEHHGGNIWAEEDNTGATFRFFLPRRRFLPEN